MLRFRSKSPTALLLAAVALGAIGGACVAMAAQPNMRSALNSHRLRWQLTGLDDATG